MKVHVYKSELDKIPVNAIPFYPHDTIEDYEFVERYYSQPPLLARDGEFWNLEEQLEKHNVPLCDACTRMNVWVVGDEAIFLHEEEKSEWGLVVALNESHYFDYEWLLPILNKHYFDLWYSYISYNFPIAHSKRPNVKMGEYQWASKVGASDTEMWSRIYVIRDGYGKKD